MFSRDAEEAEAGREISCVDFGHIGSLALFPLESVDAMPVNLTYLSQSPETQHALYPVI